MSFVCKVGETVKKVKRVRKWQKAWVVANKAFDFETSWYPCFIVNLFKTEEEAKRDVGDRGKQLKVVPVEIRMVRL